MKIKILYDNTTTRDDVLAGWGFSCLVGGNVLFDTGEDGNSLLKNMKTMKIDISDIKDIVISHDHWDHAGGLEVLLKRGKDLIVYGCRGFSAEFKAIMNRHNARLVEEKYFSTIRGNIYTTGAFTGIYKGNKIEEQALVVKTFNGITIITGCAHPGIIKIVKHVKNLFSQEKIYCVLGGFHLKDLPDDEIVAVCNKLRDIGVQKAGPAHCSGTDGVRIFKDILGKDFIQISAGIQIEV
ncbi:MAG: MBL fold metallo-hydrolase [Candidatus Omnitrophica bacterium]|nr:MBL fold metallo-hydrolase [Candidatus Omnitrophota bacterium]MBU1128345.1 MBL fold metallo-hydrolase [Candidatus Omnitrophota bacterium]MBU1784765.1 MBL fold metallo-hydrolase [Candidatus Omnitrophota bacterium]MBU1851852.1 MBL fold metallo-hydrolase [Candidatus Omnitrophota bacterium]